MATQADIDNLRKLLAIEMPLVAFHAGGASIFLVLNGTKIQVLQSKLLFESDDVNLVEKFLVGAAQRS